MSLLVFGSTALDSIITPKKKNPRLLGGSGSHAAVAASFFVAPKLIGVVGTDFPRKYISLLERHKVNLRGLKIREGKTFHWAGEYEVNMNNRRTLSTELGVVEGYSPVLPAAHRKAKYILLANNPPGAQEAIIEQLDKPKFVVADTMDLWMNIAMNDLLSLLKRVDMLVLNDSEARQLTDDDNVVSALPKLHKLGPKYVIVKKGEHGSIPLVAPGPVRRAGVPLGQGPRPDRRGRLVRRRDGRLPRQERRSGRCQHPQGDSVRKCGGVVLLRRLRREPHHQDHPIRDQPASARAGKNDTRLKLVQRRKHLGSMRGDFHLGPDYSDNTIGIDEECHPLDPEKGPPHERLVTPHAVRLADRLVLIRDQRERQPELVDELVMPGRRVGAHAQHHRALGHDLVVRIAEAARLLVAARRVIFRIKIKHDRLAAKLA